MRTFSSDTSQYPIVEHVARMLNQFRVFNIIQNRLLISPINRDNSNDVSNTSILKAIITV